MKRVLLALLVFVGSCFVSSSILFAEETKPAIKYIVKPILPANQVKNSNGASEVTGYFHISTSNGQKQTLSMQIENTSSNILQLEITPLNALTSPSGNIQYLQKNKTKDAWFLDSSFEMKPNISVVKDLTLQPNEKKIVSFTVTSPSINSGVAIASLSIKERNQASDDKQKSSFSVKNEYAMIMAVVLDFGKKSSVELEVGKADFQGQDVNPRLYFVLNNKSDHIVEDIKGTYTIKKIDGTSIQKIPFGPFKMAPKTGANYLTVIDPLMFEAGKYLIDISLDIGDGKKAETREFEITLKKQNATILPFEKDMDHINQSKNEDKPFYKQTIFLVMAGIIVLLLAMFIFVLVNSKRKSN